MSKKDKQQESQLIADWIDSIEIPSPPMVKDLENKMIVYKIKTIFEKAKIQSFNLNNLPF